MSVVPLTIDSPDSTVVDKQQGFTLKGRRVLILGVDKEQLNSQEDSNASYDLRVGSEYRDHREEGKRFLKETDSITLGPRSALIIQTEEYIHMPQTRYGIVVPKVSMLQRGVSNTFSKVDPGYHGHLLVSLFNLGKETITLHRGDRFCALTVLEMAGDARPYNKPSKQISGGSALTHLQTLSDWLEAHTGYVHLGVIVVTALLVVVELLNLAHGVRHVAP
jgi:deoxycytidine triphosphate deaminase